MRTVPPSLRFLGVGCALVLATAALVHSTRSAPLASQTADAAGAHAALRDTSALLPLLFEPALRGPGYQARSAGYAVSLTSTGATMALTGDSTGSLSMRFAGARPVNPVGERPLAARANYLHGNDPAQWRTDVPTFGVARYQGLYPGIDAVFYGNGRQLEYDVIVQSGADPRAVALVFDGADRVQIDATGDLLVEVEGHQIRQRKPVAYQMRLGTRQSVKAEYVLNHSQVGFAIGNYDRSAPLVIDPVFVYSTYFGGRNDDLPVAVAVDRSGSAYITGSTTTNFATDTEIGPRAGSWDTFVLKLDRDGQPVYLTTIGGNDSDLPLGITVDQRTGAAYVVGNTASADFPTTTGAFQRTYRGSFDAFVLRLPPSGNSLSYSTYFGGTGTEPDFLADIAVDADGNAYIAGATSSGDLPVTAGVIDPTNTAGNETGFVAKFNAAATSLLYSTYLTGTNQQARALAIDASRRVVVGGNITGTMTTTRVTGSLARNDAFVMQLNDRATSIVYAARFGGTEDDLVYDVALDRTGTAHVTGYTQSPNFPVLPDYTVSTSLNGFGDAFVAGIYPNGVVGYGTYLGGSSGDLGSGIAVNGAVVTVTGETQSADFPLVTPLQGYGGNMDAFVAQIYGGYVLRFSTYVGGSSHESAHSLAVDSAGTMTIVGETTSKNLPTRDAFQPALSGPNAWEGFISRLASLPRGTAGPGDLVVNVADAAERHGNWVVEADATAAGGHTLRNPDAGLAKVATAQAAPADYFEFTVPIGTEPGPYHLWLRGKADRNDYNNDSVYLQFSYADSGTDEPTQYFPIGSTSGMAIVLEEASGYGVHGWGWRDDTYGGQGTATDLYFQPNTLLRVRVQRREDGISIDQIVFGLDSDPTGTSGPYYVFAPGYPRDDDTILSGGAQEVVLWSGVDGSTEAPAGGPWQPAGDATAAGHGGMRDADAGAPKLGAPLTSPTAYFEMEFDAVADTPYRLWLRGKADQDSWNNDSVYVQFSDSVTAAGQPRWRIGTTSATGVVIEDCVGCGLKGWGWADNGYGTGVLGPLVYFSTTGTHRLRVQTREDGLTIDQIVLSPRRFLSVAPGTTKNDTTILQPSNPAQGN